MGASTTGPEPQAPPRGHREAGGQGPCGSQPLLPSLYLLAERQRRHAGKDRLVACDGTRYSVPVRRVRPRQRSEIRATKSQVMLHPHSPSRAPAPLPAEHFLAFVGMAALLLSHRRLSRLGVRRHSA
ncbi:Mu transposase domain-containing protein [Streptomyces roseus]|uniref:Mu transposase domain-containing protein n=1 Tax=Streptomyces roseus TaxID=66430 RepID=UPI003CC920A6